MSGLVDASGNSVTIPHDNGTNLYKVCKVEHQSCFCNLNITPGSQSGSSYAGGIDIGAVITDSSGNPINWTITLPDGTPVSGTGNTASASWDGKTDGKIVPGTYTATITASSSATCSKTSSIPITIAPFPNCNSCGLQVQVGSRVNVATGNLSQSIALFEGKGNILPISLTLYYNSLSPANGSLGLGWSHDYDISLTQNSNGSVLLNTGNWRQYLYTLSGSSYVSQAGDFSKLVKNSDGTFIRTLKDGVKYNFTSDGKLSTIADRNGNTQIFTYTSGNLTKITDPNGQSATLAYDSSNHLTSVTALGGTYTFSVSSTLNSVTLPDTGQWQFTYDDKYFMLTKSDPLNNVTTYSYDGKHRLDSTTDPQSRTRSVSYPTTSGTARTTTFMEKDGGAWQYAYDITTGALTSVTDPQSNITSYTYDGNFNTTSVTKPGNKVTSYTYDAAGNIQTITNPLDKVTSYTYNSLGQVLTTTDANGHITTNSYDTNGNLLRTVDPVGATTSYEYDGKGNATKITNANNQATLLSYSANNLLAAITDPAGAVTSFTYDVIGNLLSRTDAVGNITTYEYDIKNRLTKATDALKHTTVYNYDKLDNCISRTDANGNTTTYKYNYRGQMTELKNALGNITTFSYGSSGCPSCGGGVDKLTSVTDANGNTTGYQYDSLGRMIKETDPQGNNAVYSYDALGNIVSRTDANGNTVNFTYDALGRLLKKVFPDGTTTTFAYDANGNILTAANQYITYALTYDNNNRIISVSDSLGRNMGYEYDYLGNLTKFINPLGGAINYTYGITNLLSRLYISGTDIRFKYDKLGRVTSQYNFLGSFETSFYYDAVGHIIAQRESPGQTTIYTYDNNGNMSSFARKGINFSFNYSYDALDRLASVSSSVAGRNESYNYDAVGNRVSGPDSASVYAYAPGNELISSTGKTYQYDNNGNQIKKVDGINEFTYEYDFENRLSKVVKSDGTTITTVTFKYDPFGRRIEKDVSNGGITTVKKYLYDGENIIHEYDGNDTLTVGYVHNLGLDQPLTMVDNLHGGIYSYRKDIIGSIISLSEIYSMGITVQGYGYDSFGNLILDSDAQPIQPYTYTGREYDSETGLYYYRARYYDPKIGRFISKDPIGFNGGINLYAYVQNNPINWIDPSGLSGILTIYSNGSDDGSSGSGGLSGHSWISYAPDGGKTTTYGTWGNNPYGKGNGLHENLELGRQSDASRNMHINDEQEAKLFGVINDYKKKGANGWGYTSPCSSFASDAWNGATGESLSPYGPYSNPSSLMNSIIDANHGVRNLRLWIVK